METLLIKTFQNIEQLLLQEVQKLGINNCKIINRGVICECEYADLYKLNYFSRFAIKILLEIKKFNFDNNQEYYDAILDIPSENFLRKNGTLSVNANLNNSIFNTPLFASMLAKDAICDRFRSKTGERPSVDKDDADVTYHIYINGNEATIYLDSSGESLHKRGYKVASHPAPINEVTAAAMVKMSEWNGECDLIDFMCGSGTILIEAAMQALNIPAGFYREHFGFFSWLDFDKQLWESTVNSADIKSDIPVNLYGYDISPKFLYHAKENVANAELQDFIHLKVMDFADTEPIKSPSLIITNPPYDERLVNDDIEGFYAVIGDTLKHNYQGSTAFIISSNLQAVKSVGLRTSKKMTLFNGPLECKYLKYELY